MPGANDPIITCTQKQLAWDAWRKADNPTLGLLAAEQLQRDAFEEWWRGVVHFQWPNLRALIFAAWEMGAARRRTFEEYWQAIVDSQPQEVRGG